jgi:hypothetical protein
MGLNGSDVAREGDSDTLSHRVDLNCAALYCTVLHCVVFCYVTSKGT